MQEQVVSTPPNDDINDVHSSRHDNTLLHVPPKSFPPYEVLATDSLAPKKPYTSLQAMLGHSFLEALCLPGTI